jgi:small-conductance mechanosensitive channel
MILSDLVNPATFEGAVFYALVFVLFAVLAGALVRRSSRRLIVAADDELQKARVQFIAQIARAVVYVVVVIVYAHLIPSLRAAGTALLASASVMSIVLGLAAQNTLGNLIAGVSILLYKPFQLGDRLEVNAPGGVENAVVEKITMGNTVLRTYDNRRVVVPNSVMVGQTIINLSSEDLRVLAIVPVNIAYSADIAEARRILIAAAEQHPLIESVDSCPVMELGASSVTLTLRAWSHDAASARGAEYDLFETAVASFQANGIEIPFPTMNVNVGGPGAGKQSSGVASG